MLIRVSHAGVCLFHSVSPTLFWQTWKNTWFKPSYWFQLAGRWNPVLPFHSQPFNKMTFDKMTMDHGLDYQAINNTVDEYLLNLVQVLQKRKLHLFLVSQVFSGISLLWPFCKSNSHHYTIYIVQTVHKPNLSEILVIY